MENYIFVFDSTEITVLPCLFDFFSFFSSKDQGHSTVYCNFAPTYTHQHAEMYIHIYTYLY